MKTQKNFRKRALLSSVAMLLVATVAVGSATFAWFTQSPTATASGLKMKATSANGLKILTESRNLSTVEGVSKDFASTDILNYYKADDKSAPVTNPSAFLLDPVSIQFTAGTTKLSDAKAYATVAEKYEESASFDAAEVSAITGASYNSGKYYEEDIYCKLVGASDKNEKVDIKLDKLDIQFADSASNIKNSVRVLVSYNDTIIGAYAPSALANQSTISAITASEAEATKGKYLYGDATKGSVDFNAWSSVSGTSKVTLGEVGTFGTDKVTVTIYLDGEHSDCKSSNIDMNTIISNVDVSLTIAE